MFATIRDWLGFGSHDHLDSHGHSHDGAGGHGHTHGVIDASLTTTDRGIWAIKWSFIILAVTAALQLIVVIVSNSVALLADTIHNIADATTAIPLWVAFVLARRKPSDTFTYGLGRVEDLAGILIVLIILFSALVAGYEAIDRLIHPHSVTALGWLAAAGVIGFLGNEAVAVFRIRVGRQMNSAALIADGYHARTDGLTSLAVVLGALGVWVGFPLADPIIGLLITVAIMGIVWQSARAVLTRSLDGVEPKVTAEIRHAAEHVPGIARVVTAKARWIGHRLHADVGIAANDTIPLAAATGIARDLKAELFEHLPALRTVNIMFEPLNEADAPHGSAHHHAPEPFRFQNEMAEGVVEIVDTPKGERMRLTVTRPVAALQAVVIIDRQVKAEMLPLLPTGDCIFESAEAPAEPHHFTAQLRLTAGDMSKLLTFRMEEPKGHLH
jgi:cation diffusion facilitator family transporter